MPVGVGPSIFPGKHRTRIREPFGHHQSLECCEPSSGSPRLAATFNSSPSAVDHSFQVKCPCSESSTARAKACACQGSAKTGPPSSRGSLGTAAKLSGPLVRLGWLKVVVPHVNVNGILRCGLLAPQFTRRETHGVNVLRVLTEEMRVAVRENKNTMIAVNRPEFSARVPRQPCVSQRMHIPGTHSLTHLEPRGHIQVSRRWNASRNKSCNIFRTQRRNRFLRSRRGHATLDLGTRD